MNKIVKYIKPALFIWFITAILSAICFGIYITILLPESSFLFIIAAIVTIIGSVPALPVLILIIKLIEKRELPGKDKIAFFVLVVFVLTCGYGIFTGYLISSNFGYGENAKPFLETAMLNIAFLFCSAVAAIIINISLLKKIFTTSLNKTNTYMEQNEQQIPAEIMPSVPEKDQRKKNNILLKAGITAVLILLMLIPMLFIQNLVVERQSRQEEVVQEVSSKWSSAQTISNPYLVIPYTYTYRDDKGKVITARKNLVLLPEKITTNGQLIPQERKRSIYNVLLYRSEVKMDGSFRLSRLAKNANAANLILSEAKLCVGISDFKGIEEKINCTYNNVPIDLIPGLPVSIIDTVGLSGPITINTDGLNQTISFSLSLKIRGSEDLQFVPLSANSEFTISSVWPNPSFSGNTLPTERKITKDGFQAKWNFNQANLPFDLVIDNNTVDRGKIAFGVSMVQPADQYAQTMRCVKYALLIIGLTFALSFVIEIMQKKPVHPIQYILIGLALAIFYTLLLSVSEFILFDYAYIIASLATISLIVFYMQSHFKSWKVAGLFTAILSLLYGFIYVLIKLEDTALLAGSIALFIILALVMYATRKINWYRL